MTEDEEKIAYLISIRDQQSELIDALKAENERLRAVPVTAENAKLREALEQIRTASRSQRRLATNMAAIERIANSALTENTSST